MNDHFWAFVTKERIKQFVLFLLLIAAGLTGNYFHYEIFFSIQFLFGSFFTMLALQALGVSWGVVTGLVVSSITWHLWNHPYAIVIMTLEVVVTGLLYHRKNIGLVLADALYWLCLGIPLVLFFYYGVMHLALENTTVTAFKQAVNGIANALFARLFFMVVCRKRMSAPSYSFREVVFNLIIFSLLVPSLLVLAIQSRFNVKETDKTIKSSISFASQRSQESLADWLDGCEQHLAFLADTAVWAPVIQMQHRLEQTLGQSREFLRIGLMNTRAVSVAYAPAKNASGRSNLGRDFSDRPYLPKLKTKLRPMLTEAMMGRIGMHRPIAAILEPIISKGEFNGYVGGVLNLERAKEIISLNSHAASLTGLLFTLLDGSGRVLLTNRKNIKVMEPFSRGAGDLLSIGRGIYKWLPRGRQNISVSDRWRSAYYVTKSEVGSFSEWTLVLDQPIAPYQKIIYEKYARELGLVFIILYAALALAHMVSRLLVSSLADLAGVSRDLPRKLASGAEVSWPVSILAETESLINSFRNMAAALARQFNEIQTMNDNLESLVLNRTRALKNSEERFRGMFENIQVVSLLIDPVNGLIIDANSAAAEFYGWSRETLKTMNIKDISTMPAPEVMAKVKLAHSGGRTFFQFQHRRADGSVRDVEVYAGPVNAGPDTFLYSIVHDISDRRIAEKALVEKTAELDRFFTFNLDLLCIAGLDGHFRRLNPEWEHCLGYSLTELMGASLIDYVHPDDRQATSNTLAALSHQKTVLGFVNRYRAADGSYRWLEWRAFSFGSLTYAAARDITGRLQTEEKVKRMAEEQRLILDTLTVGVIFLRKRRVLWANAAMCAMFGYEMGEIHGIQSREIYADEQNYQRVSEGYAVLATGQPFASEEVMKRKDGSFFQASLIGKAVDPADPFIGSIWMIQNITERKAVEEERRQAEAALLEKTQALEELTENLERRVEQEVDARRQKEQMLVQQAKLAAMGEMIGAIAHQWRQPLNTIGLCVQNVRDAWRHGDIDQELVENTTAKAMTQIQHMSQTIDDFRCFFLPDKQRNTFDTMEAAGEVLALFSAQLASHGIKVELVCQSHDRHFTNIADIVSCQEKMVDGYKNEFEHALLNLVNNAKDAIIEKTGKGKFPLGEGGHILFEFGRENKTITIRVSDNGGGIPAEVMERIFEPYFTTRGPGGGTGIGLYMSKTIIEEHMHGKLTAANHADGAVFTIELPAAAEVETQAEANT